MQTPQQQQQQQQQQFQQHMQQQRASAIQAATRLPNGRHGPFEMGQPSQGWGYGSGPLPGMSQGRPSLSGFPNMIQQSLLQQHQQEILDMSDFPALGAASGASSNPGLTASYASTAGTLSTASPAAGNSLSQDFSIEDDFPALPGARPNSAGSSRAFGSLQLHQQQTSHQNASRSQNSLQHHPSQQQGQHLTQQSQLDGMNAFSSMMSPTSGSQMQQQQSLQLQQHLANDMMFQQQQQLLHLNGNLQGSSTEQGKSVKSYATKAGNGSGVFHSSAIGSASVSSSSSSAAPTISLTGNNAAHLGLSQTGSSALASSRKGDLSLGASLAETSGTESTPLVQAELNDHDRFGLFGMLGVIRATDQDSSILALGRDLTTLGLSLNSSEPLYGTFASPWFELQSSADIEAEFHVPACYNVQPPPPPQAKLSSVLDETLFYMFYSMPRDALQDAAAIELYSRHWRYHKELRLWLMKDQSSEHSKTPTFERGTYIFFDPNSWEKVKKDFIVMYDALEERRQVSSLGPNPGASTNAHIMGSSLANGAGSLSTLANGLDTGTNADLLSSLNSAPGMTVAQQNHMKQTGAAPNALGASLHGAHPPAFQQRQKSVQLTSMGSSTHGPFTLMGSHSLNSSKTQ